MRHLVVEVAASDTASSIARVSVTTFKCLGATWGSYVSLQRSDVHDRARVFRLEMDTLLETDDRILIDHWPKCDAKSETSQKCTNLTTTGSPVYVTCVTPADIQVAQVLTLAPVMGDKQLKLALPFVQILLQRRVLMEKCGSIALQWDGVDYGEWTFEAFFPGRSRAQDNDRVLTAFDGGIVTDETLVLMFPSVMSSVAEKLHGSERYYPIGTHSRTCRELVAMALRQTSSCGADEVTQVGAIKFHSLLVHAPSGAGKTTLVKQIAEDLVATLLVLDGGLLASPQLRLEDFFSAALRMQPCVLLLEDLELMFPMTLDEAKYRLVCRLVKCFDSLQKLGLVRIAVVGTVSVLNALHSKVRQLFVEEVYLDVPEKQWTIGLLQSLLPLSPMLRNEFITSLAVRYGQRPSNIASIAQQICARLSREDRQTVPVERFESEIAAFAREISSSCNGADTLSVSIPDVSWDDIGGLEGVKQKLAEMVVWPLEKPQVFRRMGISPPLGMVLHGPPGTGKTMLAKATAKASGCNFLNLVASDLMKAEIGESEKSITRAFDTARALGPCMVFIDEFQSLFGNRLTAGQTTSRMISQLLMELDALKAVSDDRDAHSEVHASTSIAAGRVFVLAATNALSAIDPAFLQPGRFENVVYVDLPNATEREAILETQRKKMPWSHDVDLARLVEDTDGANAASMVALCQAAAIQAMQRVASDVPVDEQYIAMVDFATALAKGTFDFQNQ